MRCYPPAAHSALYILALLKAFVKDIGPIWIAPIGLVNDVEKLPKALFGTLHQRGRAHRIDGAPVVSLQNDHGISSRFCLLQRLKW